MRIRINSNHRPLVDEALLEEWSAIYRQRKAEEELKAKKKRLLYQAISLVGMVVLIVGFYQPHRVAGWFAGAIVAVVCYLIVVIVDQIRHPERYGSEDD